MAERKGERGNIFFTLFGAVALVGIIGIATSTLLRGPLGTVVSLNQQTKADSQMQIAQKLAILAATDVGIGGDCDADNMVEPLSPETGTCSISVTGGGCLPLEVGSSRVDPWGTEYGYCAWDHGAASCGRTGVLAGSDPGMDKVTVAIISGGPDGVITSSCAADPGYVTESGDDVVLASTYAEAAEASNGLWSVASGDPTKIETDKGIDVAGPSQFSGQTDFTGGARLGDALDFRTLDNAALLLPTQNTEGSKDGQCFGNGANAGSLRVNDTLGMILEICDPLVGWVEVGGSGFLVVRGLNDLDDAITDEATNLFLGSGAGQFYASATSTGTTGVGLGALGLLTGGDDNVALGYQAGNDLVSGSGNILIGSGVQAGGANVDGLLNLGNILYASGIQFASSANVGIGSVAAGYRFNVDGDTNIAGDLDITGALGADSFTGNSFNGGTFSGSSLTVTGNMGGATMSTSGNATVGGNASVTGTLGVTGNTTLSGTLGVTGATTLSDTLDVTGATTLSDTLDVTGATTLSDTLDVTGVTTLSDNLLVSGRIGVNQATPNVRLDVGGEIVVGSEGTACGAGVYGGIRYGSGGDLLEVCSSVTGNWEGIATTGGGGGGIGGKWDGTKPGNIWYADGNVGIGTSLPSYQLSVDGDVIFFDSGTGTQLSYASAGLVTNVPVDFQDTLNVTGTATFDGTLHVTTNGARFDNDVLLKDGAANDPALTFLNDTDTGLFSAAADQLGFAIGGAEELRIDAAGNLLINTTAVSAALKVDVEGDVGAIQYCDENGASCFTASDISSGVVTAPGNDSEILFNSGGILGTALGFVYDKAQLRMGIGTGSPEASLDIATNGAILLPRGTDGDRPASPVNGMLRYNSSVDKFEGYQGGTWFDILTDAAIAAGAQGQIQFNSGGAMGADANLFWDITTSRLGIGTAPDVSVHTAGTLKIGDGGETCTVGADAGMIRYNGGAIEYCNGASWESVAAGGAFLDLTDTPADYTGQGLKLVRVNAAENALEFLPNNQVGPWSINGDDIYYNSGTYQVGIGTNVPDDALDVVGTAQFTSAVLMGSTLSVADDILASDGSAADPAYSFSSDFDTGFFSDVANELGFTAGGAEAARIDSSGNLLIGTGTVSASLLVDVEGDLGAVQYCDENGANCFTASDITGGVVTAPGNDREIIFNSGGLLAAAPGFVFTSTGRMGIGTSVVAEPAGSFTYPVIKTVGGTGIGSSDVVLMAIDNASAGSKADLGLFRARGTGEGAEAIVQDGDGLGGIRWAGYDGADWQLAGSIDMVVSGAPGANNIPTDMIFNLSNGSTFEAARFTSAGRLLVGRSSLLDLSQAGEKAQFQGDVTLLSFGATNKADLDFVTSRGTESAPAVNVDTDWLGTFRWTTWDGAAWGVTGTVGAQQQGAVASNRVPTAIVFETEDTNADGMQERMRLTPTGQLIVGESGAPPYGGAIQARGNGWTAMVAESAGNNAWENAEFYGRRARGTIGGYAAVQDNDEILDLRAQGWDGNSYELAGAISMRVDGAVADGQVPGDMVFITTDSAGTSLERMNIGANGRVGVGDFTADTVDAALHIRNDFTPWILFTSPSFGGEYGRIGAKANENLRLNADAGFSLSFGSDGVSERMLLTSTGLFGIGTETPATILDIAGTFKVADGGETCTVGADGGMVRWNGTNMQYCDGVAWQNFANGAVATPGAPDRGIQYNSGGLFYASTGFVYTSIGRLGIATADPQADVDIATTDAILMPRGTTPQRPGQAGTPMLPVDGMMRYNTQKKRFEGYQDGQWKDLVTNSTGGNFLFVDLTDTPVAYSSGDGGKFVRVNALENGIEFSSATINELDDVNIAGPALGELLGFDGSNWVNVTPPPTDDGDWTYNGANLYFNSGGGFIGIGTNTPANALEVVGTVQADGLQVDGVAGAAAPTTNIVTDFLGLTDTPGSYNSAGNLVRINGGVSGLEFVANILDAHDDVNVSSVVDGEVLMYSAGAGGWVSSSVSAAGGVTEFTGLTDTPAAYGGQGGKFTRVNAGETGLEFTDEIIEVVTGGAPNAMVLNNLGDTSVGAPNDNDILQFDSATQTWVSGTISTVANLNDLGDVSVGGVADGEVLTYSAGGGIWVPGAAGGGAFTELSDTPASYSSQAGRFVKVNLGETGLEFTDELIESVSGPAPAGLVLNDLSDTATGAPNDNDILQFDSASQTWVSGTIATVANLNDLGDVSVGGVADGEVLTYSAGSGAWVPGSAGAGSFTGLTDTPANYTGQGGKFAVVNTGETALEFTDQIIEIVTGEATPTGLVLNDLGDTSVAAPSDSDVLTFNSATQTWVAGAIATVANLSDLGDVTVTTPALDECLSYNGSAWVNSNSCGAGIWTDSGSGYIEYASTLGGLKVASVAGAAAPAGALPTGVGGGGSSTLVDLTDTTITTPANGECLSYNGSAWVNSNTCGAGIWTDSGSGYIEYASTLGGVKIAAVSSAPPPVGAVASGGGNLVDLGDITITTPANGECLSYNGTAWVNSNSCGAGIWTDSGSGYIEYTSTLGGILVNGITGGQPPVGAVSSAGGNLGDLGDITLTTPANGECLSYNGSAWVNSSSCGSGGGIWSDSGSGYIEYTSTLGGILVASITGSPAPSGAVSSAGGNLGDLGDITLTTPANGECLSYNGSAWVNSSSCGSGGGIWSDSGNGYIEYASTYGGVRIAAVAGTTMPVGAVAAGSGGALSTLSDTTITSPANGECLSYNGSAWVNSNTCGSGGGIWTDSGSGYIEYSSALGGMKVASVAGASIPQGAVSSAGGNLGDLGDITITGPANGECLSYNGSAWVNSNSCGAGIWTDSGSGYIEYASTLGGMKVAAVVGAAMPSGAVGSGGGGGGLWTAGTGNDIYYNTGTPQVGIGTAAPDVALDVVGDIEYTGFLNDVSDIRLKTDIKPLSREEVMSKLSQVNTYSFRMKADPQGRIEYGVMAQELEKLFPELVKTADDEMGTKSVNYIGLIAPLIEASKELQEENSELRAELDEMKLAQENILREVKGLKAHTGYGVNKAQIGLFMIAGMLGGGLALVVMGGLFRNRKRSNN
jgi:hypothetical protein